MNIDREIVAAGLQLKRVLCARLLGEISAGQYDVERSTLLEQYRQLAQCRAPCDPDDEEAFGLGEES